MAQVKGIKTMALTDGEAVRRYGVASFTIEHRGLTLTMWAQGKARMQVRMTDPNQYSEIHDWVKAKMLSIGENQIGPAKSGLPYTRNLAALPKPARLRELMRALAMLDAILEPEWES